jgi:hypothetical protein
VDLDLILLAGLYLIVGVFTFVFGLRRILWRCRGRIGFYPSTAQLGNALHQLQTIAEPQVEYVIEEKLDEEAEEHDVAGPLDPIRHLHRQARKIRRGERLNRLTAVVPRK